MQDGPKKSFGENSNSSTTLSRSNLAPSLLNLLTACFLPDVASAVCHAARHTSLIIGGSVCDL